MVLFRIACLIGLLVSLPTLACALELPPHYPAFYRDVIMAGRMEGKVVLYTTVGRGMAEPLVHDFRMLYPDIRVELNEVKPRELYERFRKEVDAGSPSGDVIWSSAMDLQMRLVSDGYAQTYMAPDTPKLPAWAVFRDLAWSITLDPIVFIYNKQLISEEIVPKTHIQIVRLIREQPEILKGRVGITDPEKNSLALLLLGKDASIWPHIWDLAAALGRTEVKAFDSTNLTIDLVSEGRLAFAYNAVGSYALLKQRRAPDLMIVYPKDYILAYSKIAFISKSARQPNAAKLLVDYLLSQRGQLAMAERAQLFPVRNDIEGRSTARMLTHEMGERLKPIAMDYSPSDSTEENQRRLLLRRWNASTNWK